MWLTLHVAGTRHMQISEEAGYLEVVEFNERLNELVQDLPPHYRRLGAASANVLIPLARSPCQGFTVQRYLFTKHVSMQLGRCSR